MRPARSVSSRNAPQALRAAKAPIRHCRMDCPAAQPIGHRRSVHPQPASARTRCPRATARPRRSVSEGGPKRASEVHHRRCIFPRVRPRRRGPMCFGAVRPANRIAS
jgi:hypothetical protein